MSASLGLFGPKNHDFVYRKIMVCFFSFFCIMLGLFSSAWAVSTPLDDDTEFVRQVYRDFLNREPDAAGLTYWTDQLQTGAYDRAELVEQYLNSAEFGQTVAPVVRLYFTYFMRIPDYEGLMFWVNSYSAGMSLNDISDAFASSQEFIDRYGSLTNEEFVSQMYVNVYGREPDAGGLAFWTGHLDAANLTRGQVMVEFSAAAEYLAISANQVYVTMTYMGLMRRAPDQEGFDYWVGIMDQGATGLALIDSFLYSSEYMGRFNGEWVITGLEIIGPSIMTENSSAAFSAMATWEGGRTSLITPVWEESSVYTSIDSAGVLTASDLDLWEQVVSVSASYTSGQATQSDLHDVTIEGSPYPDLAVGINHNLAIEAWATDIYQFTPSVSSYYQIALTNTQSDLSWMLFDTLDFYTEPPMTFCDTSWAAANEICFTPSPLTAGTTYYLVVDEWDNLTGTYTLLITAQ